MKSRLSDSAVDAVAQYTSINGASIAYRVVGSGPPILMANRFRGTLDTWDPAFLDALAKEHTVIPFDFPGVGYSEGTQLDSMEDAATFIEALRRSLDLDHFVILGWSWGGLAVQSYMLAHPEAITHAILLATNPAGEVLVPLSPDFLERALKPVNDLADEEVLFFEPASELSRQRAEASRNRIRQRSDVDLRIPQTQEQFLPYFAAAQGFHADVAGRRSELEKGATPSLVLCGDHDNSTAGQNWFPLIGRMRNAKFVFYSETGHAPHHQYPKGVAEEIGRFLQSRGD